MTESYVGQQPSSTDLDCLRLDVTAPKRARNLPIVVYLHGGAFRSGSGFQADFDGAPLARTGHVIVITINYRLGVFGFLELGGLSRALHGSGDNGLRDQIAALRWVRRNARAFGGNPSSITVMGQSAGAISISGLLASRDPRRLFARAILESGSGYLIRTASQDRQAAREFLALGHIHSVGQLERMSVGALLRVQKAYLASQPITSSEAFAPEVDGNIIPSSPMKRLADGSARGIPLLLGSNENEATFFTLGSTLPFSFPAIDDPIFPTQLRAREAKMVAVYTRDRPQDRTVAHYGGVAYAMITDQLFRLPAIRMAQAQAAVDPGHVWMYRFDWHLPDDPSAPNDTNLGAIHTLELPFVFGTLRFNWIPHGAHATAGQRARRRRLSDRMMAAWLSFIRTGNPNRERAEGVPRWPSYNARDRPTMLWSLKPRIANAPADNERALWAGYGFDHFVLPGAGSATGTALETAETRIVVNRSPSAPAVSPDVFGAIMDWPGNALGAYDPGARKFYPSFVKLLRQAGVRSVRFVDGNSARCCFEWQRAVGPVSRRRPGMVLDGLPGAASNVGPDELGSLIDQVGADGMAITNFDRASARDAADWVAYMTLPAGKRSSRRSEPASHWARLRAKNGHPAPYPIRYWDVGNEEDLDPSGWITGTPVSVGHHRTHCSVTLDCLYAFGGTTAFTRQPVVGASNLTAAASRSTGRSGQSFYAAAPPILRGSQTLYVGGVEWRAVSRVSQSGPRAAVYQVNDATGKLTFGTGKHGMIPPAHSQITLSYRSGPHDGFIQYYAAMKAANPRIRVCADAEDAGFFAAMGTTYRYDCVSWHDALFIGYPAPDLGDSQFMEQEFLAPQSQATAERAEQRLVDRYARRRVPVLPTAYGHAAGNQPADLPDLHLSLIDGLVEADQLQQWIALGIPVADRYQLNDETFRSGGPPDYVSPPGAAYNVLIAGNGRHHFVLTPDGMAMGLVSQLAGETPIRSRVEHGPSVALAEGKSIPVLTAEAARDPSGGGIDMIVVNQSLKHSVLAEVSLPGGAHGWNLRVSTLNGPSATSYNSPAHPRVVRVVTTTGQAGGPTFAHRFPAHSLTLIVLTRRR